MIYSNQIEIIKMTDLNMSYINKEISSRDISNLLIFLGIYKSTLA